jgi:IS30 family transposase
MGSRIMAKKSRPKERKRPKKRGKKRQPSRKVTPEVRDKIEEALLKGRPLREIARNLGLAESTIRYHQEHTIEPAWRERSEERRHAEIAKVDLLERIAWERFEKSTRPETRRQIKQAMIDEGADPQIIERVLTTTTRVGEACWVSVIEWCIDWRARLHGGYSPEKHEHSRRGEEFRVAGRPRQQILADIAERLAAIDTGTGTGSE